ncbi:MAG: M20 metallopeptidase family protein [Bacteroidota bacterium]
MLQSTHLSQNQELWQKASAIEPWLIAVRREFHRHPELGMAEHWTSRKIDELLEEMGIPHRTGIANTGILGIIKGGKPGKTIALRADMDALPIREETGLSYASINEGRMHACGHDAHLAILLGAAQILNSMKMNLSGNIKLFFQPAEETDGGARPMIEAGCMENPKVDHVLGLHVTPYAETGQILVRPGKICASSDGLTITVRGKSAHGAYPEAGIDAVVIAAQIITSLQTIVSRNLSPLDAGVITIGTINGGLKENIIADQVRLGGTIRTLDPETRTNIQRQIRELVSGVAAGLGGEGLVKFEAGYPPVINDEQIVKVIQSNAAVLLRKENVLFKEHPSMGVEDFAYFCQAAPSAFYYLGCANHNQGIVAPGHSSKFQIDEACLKTGVLLQVVNALSLLK